MTDAHLKAAGWLFESLEGLYCLTAFVSVYLSHRREWAVARRIDSLPSADDLQRGLSAERQRPFNNLPVLAPLLAILHPKAKDGLIQEEAVLSALEAETFSRGAILRELVGIFILTGLFFTFLSLGNALSGTTAEGMTKEKYESIVRLVGMNWPAILGGLCCSAFAIQVRRWNDSLFRKYRTWLEVLVFPKLGASRGTMEQLKTALGQFNTTAGEMMQTMAPLQQLGTMLTLFQTTLVNELGPAISEAFSNVNVGLSESALREFHAVSTESKKMLAKLTNDQAKIVALYEASERRSIQIGEAINLVAGSVLQVQEGATLVAESVNNGATSADALRSAVERQQTVLLELTGQITSLGSLTLDASGILASHLEAVSLLRASVEDSNRSVDSANSTVKRIGAGLFPIVDQLPAFQEAMTVAIDRWQATAGRATEELKTLTQQASQLEGAARLVAASSADSNSRTSALVSDIDKVNSALVKISGNVEQISPKVTDLGAWQDTSKALLSLASQWCVVEPTINQLPSAMAAAVKREMKSVWERPVESLNKAVVQVEHLSGALRELSKRLTTSLAKTDADYKSFNPAVRIQKPTVLGHTPFFAAETFQSVLEPALSNPVHHKQDAVGSDGMSASSPISPCVSISPFATETVSEHAIDLSGPPEFVQVPVESSAGDSVDVVHEPVDGSTPRQTPLIKPHKVGRNEPCPCGSGLKYKRCHGT